MIVSLAAFIRVPISFLVSTRIVTGMIAITPWYAIAVILSFVASRFTTVILLGQSSGLYDHYFSTLLNPLDLLWSFAQAIAMALTILLIHTYFGYTRRAARLVSASRRATRCERRSSRSYR